MNTPPLTSNMMSRIEGMFADYESALFSLREGFHQTQQSHPSHPLDWAIRYRFLLDDAIHVLKEEKIFQQGGIEYLQGKKSRLDEQFATLLATPTIRDIATALTHHFIQERLQAYLHYTSFFPSGSMNNPYFLPEFLSRRSSLEALITHLQVLGEDVSEYRSHLNEADALLKRFANLEWIAEDTAENRVLELAPSIRWWWYRENYPSL